VRGGPNEPGFSPSLGSLAHVVLDVVDLEFQRGARGGPAAVLLNERSGKIGLASRLGRLLQPMIYDSLYNFMSLKNRLSTV